MLQQRAFFAAAPSLHGRFVFVDALRGVAALLVAWHHITLWGPLEQHSNRLLPDFALTIARNGQYGVQMFFVISGFVIAYSIRGARVTPGFLGSFALRRSLRLDPPYWTAIVCVLALHVFGPLTGVVPSPYGDAPPQAPQIIAHLFYVQDILGSLLHDPATFENLSLGFWTLCIEVQFYLLLVIFVGVAQRLSGLGRDSQGEASGASLLTVFAPLALASLFLFHPDHAYDPWIIRYFCMFFLGSLAWWTLEGRLPSAAVWLYAAAMVARLFWSWNLGVAIALVTGLAIYNGGRLGRLHAWGHQRWLQFLGRISYSLYLIHYPVSHVIENVGVAITGESLAGAALWLVLSLAASIAAAQLLYTFVEAPSVRLAALLKRAWQRPATVAEVTPGLSSSVP